MPNLAATMTVLEPYPGLYAYYDGRIPGKRLYSEAKNWLDDGAYSLGIATYALVSGHEAMLYDSHTSLDHARAVRNHLEGLGVISIRLVLSHWHTDHIAGNAIFADCEIIANKLTARTLIENVKTLAHKTPPINPVVMPNRLFEGQMTLQLGERTVELLQFDIHSADGTVLFLRDEGILLAGDTLEDPITYISEPQHIATHIAELDRLKTLPIRRILPDHGERERIASGGYAPSLIDANRDYLQRLLGQVEDPALDKQTLRDFVAQDTAAGHIIYFEPYETVHRANIAEVRQAHGIGADHA
ncbi:MULTISPECIES: MBL fold metallo-hydrolase [Alphaproteobacteria]|uniref:MBL fold metallo-hydrolase n=2 Tax=Alphaproteobacteria TaxID=28211 RepID=A0A512HGL6_9HYPH|nr:MULTISPECIES: MBL fold metallo-hydrolase [Alphaproteobacteria]GEO84593.1 MBL fold metallo-hydrolase [Ciceribacter naphthalenivorans]GLR22556.1 MBL fold metallo-hydrolase [Ciceribacter naphthalenivorans]GLT05412.1 MBL fold metallo-hydrolase [Sphingomonas psychrolutea]